MSSTCKCKITDLPLTVTEFHEAVQDGDLEKVILCKQQFPAVVVALRQVLVHIVPQTVLDLFASFSPAEKRRLCYLQELFRCFFDISSHHSLQYRR